MPSSRIRLSLNVWLRPWLVVTILCLIYCLALVGKNKGDPLVFVTIGTRFSEGIPEDQGGTEGYDGQFVYYIARDPSTAASLIANGGDEPAYRFQRILLPTLGMVLSFGQEDLIPWALLIVNLVALAIGTALLETLLRRRNVSRWYALGYALSLGVFGTVRLSLPETLAYTLALGAMTLAFDTEQANTSVGAQRAAPLHNTYLWGALLFALAALAKETTLIFAAVCGLHLLLSRQWRTAAAFGLIVLTPFVLWQYILYDRLGEFGVGSGGALATSFEIIPLWGVFRILFEGGLAVSGIFLALLGPFVLFPTIWGLKKAVAEIRSGRRDPTTLLLLFNAGVMLFVPFSTYREVLGILRFIVGLQIAVMLYAAERKSRRALLNSTIWALTLAFLIASDFGGGGRVE